MYYPITRLKRFLSEEDTNNLKVSKLENRGWEYTIEGKLAIITDYAHNVKEIITSCKGMGMSLKRAVNKGNKICRYHGRYNG